MLNGVTQVIITKLDVLDTFEEISVATAYKYDQMISEELPYDIVGKPIEPQYSTYAGWFESLDDVTDYNDLPLKSKEYIHQLEKWLKTKISMVSTGPEREKLFAR